MPPIRDSALLGPKGALSVCRDSSLRCRASLHGCSASRGSRWFRRIFPPLVFDRVVERNGKPHSFRFAPVVRANCTSEKIHPPTHSFPHVPFGVLSALLKGTHWIRMHACRYDHITTSVAVSSARHLSFSPECFSKHNSVQTGLNPPNRRTGNSNQSRA